MQTGHFYFIEEQYYLDFPDSGIMQNREASSDTHDRPCFYAFRDEKTSLYWMIPVSSKVGKYRAIYNRKIARYGKCDTICFGSVLGHEKAFLIQNMCPVSDKYIKNEYFDKNDGVPVRVAANFEEELIKKAKLVILLERKGVKLVFPDIMEIERRLLAERK